jgi:hypothetical protein
VRSISSIMASAAAASRQRTSDLSTRGRSSGPGITPDRARTVPMATTWLSTSTPSACRRNARATAPSATRAAVSRALARSSTGRASSRSYFCIPTRSAWPGRGRVSGALRAWASRTSGSTGSAAITVCHLGHSVLPTRIATGPPIVRPCRTPPVSSTSSASNDMRAPRP